MCLLLGSSFVNFITNKDSRSEGAKNLFLITDVTLKSINFTIQTKLQQPYADLYRKHLYFLDTIVHTSKYHLSLFPPVVVCALGKTSIVGFGMAPSEEGSNIDSIIDNFNLNKSVAIVVTDRAQGWERPINDACHFMTDVQSALGRIGAISKQFIADMNKAMFHDFSTRSELILHINSILNDLDSKVKIPNIGK